MAPKRNAAARVNAPAQHIARPITPTPQPVVVKSKKKKDNLNPAEIAQSIWQKYADETPQRTKLIDLFMAFLVVVGVLQFVYCVIVGNYVCAAAWIGRER